MMVNGLNPFEPFDVDPAFHRYIVSQAAARLEGREQNKNRPYLGIKAVFANVGFKVKPGLRRTKEGWELNGSVSITVRVGQKNSRGRMQDFCIKHYLWANGKARLASYYKKRPELHVQVQQAVLDFINLITADPSRTIPLLDMDHCAICGRGLTDPESRSVGIGPECIGYFRLIVEQQSPESDTAQLEADIRELRARMQKAHPDRGGDAGQFITLRKEFERLRCELKQEAHYGD